MSEEKKDMTEEEAVYKEQLEKLGEQISFLQNVYDTTSIAMMQFAMEKGCANVLSANNAAYKLCKYSKPEFAKKLNNDLLSLIHEEDREKFMDLLNELTVNGQAEKINLRIHTYEQEVIWVDMKVACQVNPKGKTVFQTEFFDNSEYAQIEHELKKEVEKKEEEQTEVSKQNQETLDRLLYMDGITGLYNYDGFIREAEKQTGDDGAEGCFAVLCTDINNFSDINQRFGYLRANAFLKDFGEIYVDKEACIAGARQYGASFLSLIKAKSKAEILSYVKECTKNLNVMMREQFPSKNLYLSNGLYVLKAQEKDIAGAVDKACYAKNQVLGKKGVVCSAYSDFLHMQRMQETDTIAKVKQSLDIDRVEVYLQPKFNIQNGKALGAEAFASWKDEEGVNHSASEFIHSLEDEGKSGVIDFAVYEKVCQNMKRWKGLGKELMPISINFSAIHSQDDKFVDKMCSIADTYNIDKSLIELEFSEQILLEADERLYEQIEQLRKQGFMVHMDNFGGENSTLKSLLMTPVDTVKMSMNLVSEAANSEKNFDYLNRMCDVIAQLGIDIIFRGVETKEQSEMLERLSHAGRAQGYFYEEPLKVEEYEQKYVQDEKKVEGIFGIVGM